MFFINPNKKDDKYDFKFANIEYDLKSTRFQKEDERKYKKQLEDGIPLKDEEYNEIIRNFYNGQGIERFSLNNRVFLIRPRQNIISFVIDKELNKKMLDTFKNCHQKRSIILKDKDGKDKEVFANLIIITENKKIFVY